MTDFNNGYQNRDGNNDNNNTNSFNDNNSNNYSNNNSNSYSNNNSYNNSNSYNNNNNNYGDNNNNSGNYSNSNNNDYFYNNDSNNYNSNENKNDYNTNVFHNSNNNNNLNQNNKTPEYSFWAEQVPRNSYQNNNQQDNNNNNWQNTNQIPNMNQMPGMNQINYGQQTNNKKKSGTGKKFFKFVGKAICFGLIAAISFIGLGKVVDVVYPGGASIGILTALENAGSGSSYKVNYADVASVKKVDKSATTKVAYNTLPSIVAINCTSKQNAQDWFGQQYSQNVQSSGSGIIVGKTDKELLIATNNHVVQGANDISITFKDGTKIDKAKTKGADSNADLAVVSLDISRISKSTLKAISVAKLGDSNKVKVGEMSVAIGNALGYGTSVTVGYISAKDREVDVSDNNSSSSKKMKFLQTDAAINPGNSGGALVNMEGEVIGINTVKYASDEVEGMGYAIPISTATPVIKELMSREVLKDNEKGFLGIQGFDVTDEASSYYNIPVGVYVKDVVAGGSADAAGLKAEDVITEVNNTTISSITQLREYVNSKRVGTKIKVVYMRNTDGKYKKATITVTLQKNPELKKSDSGN